MTIKKTLLLSAFKCWHTLVLSSSFEKLRFCLCCTTKRARMKSEDNSDAVKVMCEWYLHTSRATSYVQSASQTNGSLLGRVNLLVPMHVRRSPKSHLDLCIQAVYSHFYWSTSNMLSNNGLMAHKHLSLNHAEEHIKQAACFTSVRCLMQPLN